MAGENANAGHRDRMRAAYIQNGLDGWQDYVILEMILFYSISRRDTKPLAKELIKRYGSLAGVMDAPYEDLIKVSGVGERTAALLKMFPDVGRAYAKSKASSDGILDTLKKAGDYITANFVGLTREQVYIACLDSKSKLLYGGFIAEGSVNLISVSARTVTELALLHRATGVILAHNHPTGFALPSEEDRVATLKIYSTLNAVGIPLVDHIIVSGNDYVSMAQSGFFNLN